MSDPLRCLETPPSDPRQAGGTPGSAPRSARAAGPGSRLARLRRLRNQLAAQSLVPLSACLGPRFYDAFGILMYHRVVDSPAAASPPTWNVTPGRFRQQLAGLLRRGYRPASLGEVLSAGRAGRCPAPKTFVVTFDDGYENVYRRAFPVLRELGVPATVFLATRYLDSDSPFPFDDWAEAGSSRVESETWKPLTTRQCQEMQDSGLIELGSHSHGHADFRGAPETLRRDLAASLAVLDDRFGIHEPSFAFPFGYGCRGNDGPDLAAVAEQAGVRCALTTDEQLVRPGDDPLNWGRLAAFESDSAASLAAKLDGWYSLARGAWQRLRRLRNKRQTLPESYEVRGANNRESVCT